MGGDCEVKSKCLHITGPEPDDQLHCTFFHFLNPAMVMELKYHGHIQNLAELINCLGRENQGKTVAKGEFQSSVQAAGQMMFSSHSRRKQDEEMFWALEDDEFYFEHAKCTQ